MDIAAFSTVKAFSDVKMNVATALTRNAMDVAQQRADSLNEMMQKSVAMTTGVGRNIDIKL